MAGVRGRNVLLASRSDAGSTQSSRVSHVELDRHEGSGGEARNGGIFGRNIVRLCREDNGREVESRGTIELSLRGGAARARLQHASRTRDKT